MRHGDKINNLSRTASHRRALLANMAIAIIEHKRITTTLAKAKALRRYMEPLVTKAKTNTTHSRRVVFSYLQNKEAVKELFGPIADKVGDRPGGYLRIIKLGFRRGDGAETAMIEFVDFNEVYNPNAGKAGAGKKRTRRGRRGSSESTVAETVVAETAAVAEEVESKVEDVVETVAETVEEVVETVENKVEEAVEAAEEVVENTEAEAPADETEDSSEEDKKDA